MKRFLSLLFLFAALCVPTYAYKDGHPATQENMEVFLKQLDFIVKRSLSYKQYSNEDAEKYLCKFEIDKGLRPKSNAETTGISTFDKRMEEYAKQMVFGNPNAMRCRAHAAFALRQLEKLGVKSGYLAFIQKHTVEQRYPSLTNAHTVVIYSALNDRGKEEYFVCDLTEAINVAHLLKIGPPTPGLALFGPRGDLLTDYHQCFKIPFEDFLKDRTFYKKNPPNT